jgi:hypothetical protein
MALQSDGRTITDTDVIRSNGVLMALWKIALLTPTRANAKGQFVYVKYHFLANGGHKQFTAKEALRSGGEDPDYSKRDVWQAIEQGLEPLR